MGEMAPSISIVRIIFSYSCPLSLSNVGSPLLPVFCPLAIFFQTLLFLGEVLVIVGDDHDYCVGRSILRGRSQNISCVGGAFEVGY